MKNILLDVVRETVFIGKLFLLPKAHPSINFAKREMLDSEGGWEWLDSEAW